jgi:hypothetical protein
MRKRRHTRYDSRLNSIIEPGDSQSKERWVQDGINASLITRVVEGGKETVDTINDEDKEEFHSRVAKLLYLAKRARPDILCAVIFLTTRVQMPTEQDLGKLLRVLKYINGTRELGIRLGANSAMQIISHIDASFAVHGDLKGHTGCTITIAGAGPIYVNSSKQKLNSKSSTESELIALSDSASQVIWTRNFLIAQGYDVPAALIGQDNMSTMTMVDAGKSTSARTRHIAIRFFWIHDRVKQGEIKLEHVPTEDMIADILTKPLVGSQFLHLRNRLLNW